MKKPTLRVEIENSLEEAYYHDGAAKSRTLRLPEGNYIQLRHELSLADIIDFSNIGEMCSFYWMTDFGLVKVECVPLLGCRWSLNWDHGKTAILNYPNRILGLRWEHRVPQLR